MTNSIDERITLAENQELNAESKCKELQYGVKQLGYDTGAIRKDNYGDEGFEIFDFEGEVELYKPKSVIDRFFDKLIYPAERRNEFRRKMHEGQYLIGKFWLNSQKVNADYSSLWVIEAYGKDSIPKLTDLLKKLTIPQNIKIKIDTKSLKAEKMELVSQPDVAGLGGFF